MSGSVETGLDRVLASFGISPSALLGRGGESRVYALDDERVARVNAAQTRPAQVAGRAALLGELGRSAASLPFFIPEVLDTVTIGEYIVTVERRLPGTPLSELLAELSGEARAAVLRAYLEAAAQLGQLVVDRCWYGDLLDARPIRAQTFRAYLEQRARRSLKAAGRPFAGIDPASLAAALPEPEQASFVHLDAFPGNMLADAGGITAVLDFGASCIMGDRRLDPLTAAVYLDPAITPAANDEDRQVAQEWLAAAGLAGLYEPAQRWIAAYWSFALDDLSVYLWCQTVLDDSR
jgi:Ser/Thr protein kinase RdoA (MazF antagonist)